MCKTTVHRDIKPSNILLVKNKKGDIVAKIADFGKSKELAVSRPKMTTNVGTPKWMAPEVKISGGQQGTEESVDVFLLGSVFYFILSGGKQPFAATDLSSREARLDGQVYPMRAGGSSIGAHP
ncbi:Serine/threonine-protein kinase/endoribonuclease IRE1 [Amphibalanus amphitrite]|uniref:Serine/threonine-protein kinase/endoribonuclease IRE1 n=1 Tax=Amphibalanus amphitrite TaxID=1232801 RepID=A0A6A4VKP3_AMPAM|nr:Serine/threonine-protein kinase/endoribonuclease IRE1 [Amphibalanus amphitrite]